ncbi:Rieske 2Fe-2S domain-containing protein [Halomicroarcula sp. F13]|uniref:Rieske 2Fe-2S domain-containing protein n=1 Tax=Haloarcula rubra TaxID=2487747 RepID=A0AAW4PPP7_9EURY|nr:Rieske 2Fe-2S domain-containing protein [Halomicroarcula rubra]MBX0322696.1 Rieske 2Fe-2S domain-containing protein [Halomicroarcula rubra]
MTDDVRVTVEHDDDAEVVEVRDGTGEVEAGDATVQFEFGTSDTDDRAEREAGTTDAADDDEPRRIVDLDAVPRDSTLRFRAVDGRRSVDCILHRSGDAVVAWRNSCPHRPEVPLDTGTGAIVSGDQLVCHKHGARFERDEGICTAGPCAGDALDSVSVTVRDGAVYLVDERFERAQR